MVKVVLWSGSAALSFTDGQTQFEAEASNLRRLTLELERRFPGLGQHVEQNMTLAVDGEIFQDAYDVALKPASEVCLIPKIAGG